MIEWVAQSPSPKTALPRTESTSRFMSTTAGQHEVDTGEGLTERAPAAPQTPAVLSGLAGPRDEYLNAPRRKWEEAGVDLASSPPSSPRQPTVGHTFSLEMAPSGCADPPRRAGEPPCWVIVSSGSPHDPPPALHSNGKALALGPASPVSLGRLVSRWPGGWGTQLLSWLCVWLSRHLPPTPPLCPCVTQTALSPPRPH